MFQASAFQNNAFQMTAIVIAIVCIHTAATLAYPFILYNQMKWATATASLISSVSEAELC